MDSCSRSEAVARLAFTCQMRAACRAEALVLVACANDRVIAYGNAERLEPGTAPSGWYLAGTIVAPEHRRRGVGLRLARERLSWIAERSPRAYYFVNERNRASIDLHARLGFRLLRHDARIPHVTFSGGVGLLFEADLSRMSLG